MDGQTNGRRTDGWIVCLLVGWLVGCVSLRPFETVFQSISGRLQEKGIKKR